MSPLHPNHISESSIHSAQLHEPDSELRDALNRVARDLEFRNQQRQKRNEGRELLQDEGSSKEHSGHDGDDMQVEDILDHVSYSSVLLRSIHFSLTSLSLGCIRSNSRR